MSSSKTKAPQFRRVHLSLADMLGREYVESVCEARAALGAGERRALRAVAREKIDFYPRDYRRELSAWLPRVGERICGGLGASARGATSAEFAAHTHVGMAPLTGLGWLRLGEDGRLYLTSKSEHYHVPLGHGFPGHALLERARRLGVVNPTHNNTRGHITRLLEEEMVRTAAGVARGDAAGLARVTASKRMDTPNRVLNLETGSLAAEAALKMALSRFYRPQATSPAPRYAGRTPVLLVMGDGEGGLEANYHGTTVLTQAMRGMWPEARAAMERAGILAVRCVRPNRIEDLEEAFERYERPPYKIAVFAHELVMMNHAALRLTERFVKRAYALCAKHDVPTVVDEIQSCVWSPELYLFREYGIKPSFVVVGKGFPNGEYAASRVLFPAALDTLPQFGALVTNGQEELASLAYLVTMRWVEENADAIRGVGDYYEERLEGLRRAFPARVAAIEGRRHLAGVYFHELEAARAFSARLNERGLDISVQTYKKGCPPCALTKLPVTAGCDVVDFVVERMREALARLG